MLDQWEREAAPHYSFPKIYVDEPAIGGSPDSFRKEERSHLRAVDGGSNKNK
jgi:hypothetical protein